VEDGMKLFDYFVRPKPPSSAQQAKDRLQILLAHERQDRSQPEYLPMLQRDILEVIRKYIEVASDKVEVRLQRGERISTLEIGIELPPPRGLKLNARAALAR
jgi:cell division topological specificity factor